MLGPTDDGGSAFGDGGKYALESSMKIEDARMINSRAIAITRMVLLVTSGFLIEVSNVFHLTNI
jgi:hypothetical protein